MRRHWVLSFVAWWLAYKSKELAVMLPVVLAAWEYWLGKRRFVPLIPFFAAAFSFGLQGLLLNPNKDNDYTFRFTAAALGTTLPFYAQRLFLVPFSGLALLPLALVRDRRVWFGLATMGCFLFTLLFLPGRLFGAYTYLPLVGAVIAMSAASSHLRPAWIWIALALWMPWNCLQLRAQQRVLLDGGDEAFDYVEKMQAWVSKNPGVPILVYTGAPVLYHDWGVTAAWNIAHRTAGMKALYWDSAEAARAMSQETVAYAIWDRGTRTLAIGIRKPK
jgi:hypothetical protein